MRRSFLIAAVLCTVVGNAVAAEQSIPPQVQSPPDMPTELLERPRRSPADSPDAPHALLTQAEIVRLAKTAAKKENGQTFDNYDLKSVTFDPTNREWTVSFNPRPPRRASENCFLVIVKDNTSETKVLRC